MRIIKKNLAFGDAMNALLNGDRIARSAWNAYICLNNDKDVTASAVKNGRFLITSDAIISTRLANTLQNHRPHDMAVPRGTMIVAKLSHDKGYLPAWLCQTDMLAHDWKVVE